MIAGMELAQPSAAASNRRKDDGTQKPMQQAAEILQTVAAL